MKSRESVITGDSILAVVSIEFSGDKGILKRERSQFVCGDGFLQVEDREKIRRHASFKGKERRVVWEMR